MHFWDSEGEFEIIKKRSVTTWSVCVNSAMDALGLSHDGLSRHRAGLPAHLGTAVNKD